MATQKAQENKQAKQYDYDQYGFYLPIERIQSDHNQKELKQINARVEKWRKMIPNISQLIQKQDKKLKERIRKGIPDGIRLKVWPNLAQIDQIKQQFSNHQFSQLIKEPDFPYQVDIAADLKRTFPNHQLFQNHNAAGLDALNNILKAVSLTHADMGYCQGLNFLAGAFMIYANDEESYHIINSMLVNYDCMKMFLDVGSIRKQLYVHDQLVKKFLPDISDVMSKNNVESMFFATGWYMTLFSSVLPFQYFLRVMDIFFYEKWKIIYRVALAILKLKRKELLQANSFEGCMKVVKDFSAFEYNQINQDKFFQSACKDFIFSKKLLVELEQQYDTLNPPDPSKKRVNRPLQDKVKASEQMQKEMEGKQTEQQKQELNLQTKQNEQQQFQSPEKSGSSPSGNSPGYFDEKKEDIIIPDSG